MGRQTVKKTYKLYINGAFVRSERGRVLKQEDKRGNFVANYSWATRKDFRNAVVAARKAQSGWAGRSAMNRSLIMYRISEMLEDKRELFVGNLTKLSRMTTARANARVDQAIDLVFYYAGWADKYASVLSSVNPVAAPFFNFTVPEPMGVVALFSPAEYPLLGLLRSILPAICSGNTVILSVDNTAPTIAIDLAEVLAISDLPSGVVNILTGQQKEIISFAAGHMDVNALAVFDADAKLQKKVLTESAENLKRVSFPSSGSGKSDLSAIEEFVDLKTAWHPIGV